MKRLTYPFKAKSTAYLQPGQFWGFPLVESELIDYPGWYGCGRVLQLEHGSRRWFLAGWMDWVGRAPPTRQAIAGCGIAGQIVTHTDFIRSEILGIRPLEQDQLEPLVWLGQSSGNHANPHQRPDVMRGLQVLREATALEHQELLKAGRVYSLGGFGASLQGARWYAEKIAQASQAR